MKFYADAMMGPEWDAPDGPSFTLHVLTTPHGRAVSYGPYAFEESARADLLDWVYGLGAYCGWVTDHAGAVVASVDPRAARHVGAVACAACDGLGFGWDAERHGALGPRYETTYHRCARCGGAGAIPTGHDDAEAA